MSLPRAGPRLIVRFAGGTIEALTDEIAAPRTPAIVKLRHEQVKRLLGLEIPINTCKEILNSLGMDAKVSTGEISVVAPSWRHDISQEADLIEIARINGYQHIPAGVMPQCAQLAKNSPHDHL